MSRASDVAQVLDQVSEEKREIFWLYRRSEAYLAVGEHADALQKIDLALETYAFVEHRPTFLAHRANVLLQMNNLSHEDVLLSAIDLLADGRFKERVDASVVRT